MKRVLLLRIPLWMSLVTMVVLVSVLVVYRVASSAPLLEAENNRQSGKAEAADCSSPGVRQDPNGRQHTENFLSAAYIMPHPPDFLTGREIRFYSYRVVSGASGARIVFKEARQGKAVPVDTVVDGDSVKWY